jgi:hypothetical protein
MTMFGAGYYRAMVRMLMVFIVDMLVVVHHFFVHVFMLVALGQMQPGTYRH